MNLIVIVSDTLRRDHLGAYGNTRMITPNLDAFSREAQVFEECRPQSFPTICARFDLFTGRPNFIDLGWRPLPEEQDNLSATLSRAGYNTTAVVDNPFLHRNGYGYDRGFERFIYVPGQMRGTERADLRKARRCETDHCAPATFLAAERWLQDHRKERFFLYIDAWDPHEPWDPPNWYTELYMPEYDGRDSIYPLYGRYRDAGISDEELGTAHACYCGEITMVDRWFGRFMDTVDLLGLAENTCVVFVSDHGFYFGEHGRFGKMDVWKKGQDLSLDKARSTYRSPLYEEITRVPLMIRVPGYKPRRINKGLVTLSDIMPTALELTGTEIPRDVRSKSLVPLMDQGQEIREFSVTSAQLNNVGDRIYDVDSIGRVTREISPATISTHEWTLLYAAKGEPAELYHLPSDPSQTSNVLETNQDVARELHREYASFLKDENADPRFLSLRGSL